MDLWIRSQDRERLTIVHDLRIYYAKQEDVWVIESCDDLAYYKTKERALEVLDEIQKRLTSCFIINGLGEHIGQSNITIYEMPKE